MSHFFFCIVILMFHGTKYQEATLYETGVVAMAVIGYSWTCNIRRQKLKCDYHGNLLSESRVHPKTAYHTT